MSDDERDRDRKSRRDWSNRFSGGGSQDRDRSPRGKKRSNRVFVSNIPYEYRWQELKDLFREQVGEVSFVELFVDENDKPRGCGIIEFASSQLANDAVDKMHRFDLKGRKLVVKEDNDVERDKYGRIIPRGESSRSRRRESERGGSSWSDIPPPSHPSNGPSSSSNASKFGNTYGLSIQFLESLNITGPLVPRVFVANLDYKVDDKKLREVFRLAGRVLSAERSVDKEGKSRGFGMVEFEHPVEAVQAISMFHNQMLFDRRLSVRLDRVEKGDILKLPEGLKGVGMGLGANGIPLQDVARNLPNSQNSPQSNPAPSFTVSTPALAAAALANQLGAVTNLIGAQGAVNDIASLTSSLGVNAPSLSTSNPIAAQLLSSTAAASNPFGVHTSGGGGSLSAFNSNSAPREFDSLSAALGGSSSGGLGAIERPSRSMSSSRPPSDAIIINNLPVGTTWQTLRDKCRDAGEVKYAEIKGKDTGIVQFTSAWDAQRAINMLDGIRVDGRIMDVRYY